MEQIRPLLARHGLFVRHQMLRGVDGWSVSTVVEHPASETQRGSGEYPLMPTKNDAQGHGAGLTYARRYTLFALLALVGDPDTDGAPAGKRQTLGDDAPITAKQRNDLMAAMREKKIPTAKAQEIVRRVAGVDNSAEIPRGKFAELLEAIRAAA